MDDKADGHNNVNIGPTEIRLVTPDAKKITSDVIKNSAPINHEITELVCKISNIDKGQVKAATPRLKRSVSQLIELIKMI